MEFDTLTNTVEMLSFDSNYNNMQLDFLIIFNQSGLSIYSKCFSDICSVFIKNDLLLSGFLSAITTFPQSLGYTDKDLKSLDLGKSRMYFSYSRNSNVVFVIGINKDSIQFNKSRLIDTSMNELQLIFNENFKDNDWSVTKEEVYYELEKEINEKIVNHWFRETKSHNNCPLGDNCPFDVASKQGRRKSSFWSSLKNLYNSFKENSSHSY
jgi:hypothetical protein